MLNDLANGDDPAAHAQVQQQMNGAAKAGKIFAAGASAAVELNPVVAVIDAASGQNPDGSKKGMVDRVVTAAAAIPVAGIIEAAGDVVKAGKMVEKSAEAAKVGEAVKAEKSAQTVVKEAADVVKGEEGVVYKVPGKDTPSGKEYVGRTSSPEGPPGRGKIDGRDRTNAEVVDKYSTTQEGRVKEQKAMDANGGVKNLDNKRNEIAPKRRKENGLD